MFVFAELLSVVIKARKEYWGQSLLLVLEAAAVIDLGIGIAHRVCSSEQLGFVGVQHIKIAKICSVNDC